MSRSVSLRNDRSRLSKKALGPERLELRNSQAVYNAKRSTSHTIFWYDISAINICDFAYLPDVKIRHT